MQHVFRRFDLLRSTIKSNVRLYSSLNIKINIRQHVRSALAKNDPVVALESTIITHGMPFPQNLNTAFIVENIIQRKGVTPATTGIIDGELIVGLDEAEIQYLAKNRNKCVKVSRRDIAYALSKRKSGGTTVSGTMLAARMANIPIFVTGGIGGVHRGAQETFDVSTDLTELARTPVAVVCAGVKSILDIPLTLEYLETQGVPVISYGPDNEFPSFFSSGSGFKAPYNLEHPLDIAKLIYHQMEVLQLHTGVVVAVPIPEKHSVDKDIMEQIIQEALEEAKKMKIIGKEITPFVLDFVSRNSDGRSLESNVKLIENNASIGADIAIEYSKLMKKEKELKDIEAGKKEQKSEHKLRDATHSGRKRPVVIGSSVLDVKSKTNEISNVAESTNSGSVVLSVGGVGRNIAEFLARCDTEPLLITALGNDVQGEIISNSMKKINMDTSGIYWSAEYQTATYNVVVSQQTGELLLAVGDMQISDNITSSFVSSWENEIKNASIVVLDANYTVETIEAVLGICQQHNVPVWFEPTCFTKASKPFRNQSLQNIDFASPNFVELNAFNQTLIGESISELEINQDLSTPDLLNECIRLSESSRNHVKNLLVTLGKDGVLLITSRGSYFGQDDSKSTMYLHYPAVPEHLAPVRVNNVSGAGDSLAGGVIYGYLKGYDKDTCIKAGLRGAYKSLLATSAISKEIRPSLFTHEKINKWASFRPFSLIPDV